ncbi:hypothetical protein LNO88_06515 [Klebsiella pneumoniae subsp. pneumoniae]|nr:hypothetical protein [Klebsiella pneumoniae subsp. pneumoniae]
MGITGGPTEGALESAGGERSSRRWRPVWWPRSLDSQYKYMSTLQHIDGNARVLITGAPDVIFAIAASR